VANAEAIRHLMQLQQERAAEDAAALRRVALAAGSDPELDGLIAAGDTGAAALLARERLATAFERADEAATRMYQGYLQRVGATDHQQHHSARLP
jgi:hypothetical protein